MAGGASAFSPQGSLARWTGKVLIVTAGTAAAQVLGFVFLLVLAARLTQSDYGQFRYILGIGMFAGNLASVGIAGALARELARARAAGEDCSGYASNALAASALLGAGASLALLVLFRDPAYVAVLAGVTVLTLFQGILEGHLLFGRLTVLLVLSAGLRLSLTVGVMIVTPAAGAWTFLAIYAGTAALAVLILSASHPIALKLSLLGARGPGLRRVLGFGGVLMVTSLCISGTQVVPLLLLERTRGLEELAIFSVALTLAMPVTLVAQGLSHVLYPKVAEREDRARRARMLRLALLYSVALSAVAVPAYYLLGDDAIAFLIGPGYGPSYFPMVLLAVAGAFMNARAVFGSVFDGSGRPGLSAAAAAVALVVTSIGSVLLVPSSGAVGAAWATLAGFIASVAASLAGWAMLGGRPGPREALPAPLLREAL